MSNQNSKQQKRSTRRRKIRSTITGTETKPRLSVFRSNTGMYLQLINDVKGVTMASAHSREIKLKPQKPDGKMSPGLMVGFELGKSIAEKAKSMNINEIVFDRGGYRYHGRVRAVAEGVRAGGLKF